VVVVSYLIGKDASVKQLTPGGKRGFAGFGPPGLPIPIKNDGSGRTHAACRTHPVLLRATLETETRNLLQ